MATEEAKQTGLLPWQHGAIFLLACAAIVSRRPGAIFHAQFWAEDGRVFFAGAYNAGWWPSLFHPYGGYFHAVPRLAAALALLAPLSLAPLTLNLIAIAAEALPVNLMLSSRSSAWGSLGYRALLAALYLASPNCGELDAIITNSQCLLALSAFLLLLAAAPSGVGARLFDTCIFLLCGLSGPYCIFLLLVALFLAWKCRQPWRWIPAALLAASCLVQAWGLLILDRSGRPHYVLGASPALFARLLAGQVYLGSLLGNNRLAASSGSGLLIFLVCVAIAGTALLVICFIKSAIEMKLFLLFSFTILAASLISPMTPGKTAVWVALAPASGAHYWFFPGLAFAWSLLWCLRSRVAVLSAVSIPLLLLTCFGIARDWSHPPFTDTHFAAYAKRFDDAPAGSAMTIPENPEGWSLRLVKRPSR